MNQRQPQPKQTQTAEPNYSDDLLTTTFEWLFKGAGLLMRHLLGRAFSYPVKFVLYLIWGAGAWWTISNWSDLTTHMADWPFFKTQTASDWASPSTTLAAIMGVGLLAVALLDLAVKRGPLCWGWRDIVRLPLTALQIVRYGPANFKRRRRAAELEGPALQVDPRFLPLGISYSRRDASTWNASEGCFEERLLENETFTLGAGDVRLNAAIIAPPNTGKTNIIKVMVRWCLRNGHNVILVDPKGDDFADLAAFATHRLNLNNKVEGSRPVSGKNESGNVQSGNESIKLCIYDPLAPTARKKGEQVAEAIIFDPGMENNPQGHYFAANSRTAFGSICELYVAAHTVHTPDRVVPGRMPTLREVRSILMSQEVRDELRTRLPKGSPLLTDMDELDYLCRLKSDPLGTLRLALNDLVNTTEGVLVGEEEGGYTLRELLNTRGTFLWVGASVSEHPVASRVLVRLLVQLYTAVITDPKTRNDVLKVLFLDEVHLFITQKLATAMAMGRAKWGAVVVACQSLAQIKDVELRRTLLATCGIKIVLNSVEYVDAEEFSHTFGAHERPYRSQTASSTNSSMSGTSRGNTYGYPSGWGLGQPVYSAGGGGSSGSNGNSSKSHGRTAGKGYSESQGETLNRQMRADWLPSELRGLPAAHAVIEWRDATTSPPGPPQQRKVWINQERIEEVSRLQEYALPALTTGSFTSRNREPASASALAPLTSVEPRRLAVWQQARIELETSVEHWQAAQTLVERVFSRGDVRQAQVQAAEVALLWVRYWDALLLAAQTNDRKLLNKSNEIKRQAQLAAHKANPDENQVKRETVPGSEGKEDDVVGSAVQDSGATTPRLEKSRIDKPDGESENKVIGKSEDPDLPDTDPDATYPREQEQRLLPGEL